MTYKIGSTDEQVTLSVAEQEAFRALVWPKDGDQPWGLLDLCFSSTTSVILEWERSADGRNAMIEQIDEMHAKEETDESANQGD